jgi:tetratricopeptide (TPR) repeat protein
MLKGIRLFPSEDQQLYMNLAATYHEMGWTKEAIDVIQQAIAVFPEEKELKEWLKELEEGPDDHKGGEEVEKPRILLILDKNKKGRVLP